MCTKLFSSFELELVYVSHIVIDTISLSMIPIINIRNQCIKSVVESDPKCPNCRADINATGSHPNFVIRDIVNVS